MYKQLKGEPRNGAGRKPWHLLIWVHLAYQEGSCAIYFHTGVRGTPDGLVNPSFGLGAKQKTPPNMPGSASSRASPASIGRIRPLLLRGMAESQVRDLRVASKPAKPLERKTTQEGHGRFRHGVCGMEGNPEEKPHCEAPPSKKRHGNIPLN